LVPNKKPGTFELEVKDVIESFGNQEFSMEHIDAALTRKGIANNIKHRRSNITSKLGKLEKKNFIERTFQGSGNIQNRYKRVQERAVLQQEKEYEEVHI
jgi:DNA-binding MarR family transcriptional regulator